MLVFGPAAFCDTSPTYNGYLKLNITQQPQGGTHVNTVTCRVSVEVVGDGLGNPGDALLKYIELNWLWKSADGHYNDSCFTFTTRGEKQDLVFSKSAPSGMYLDKKFWLVLIWRDLNGDHTVVSDTADCRMN